MKKVAFYTLGCKLNFAESSSIARSLEPMGFSRVDFQDSPNLFVINTCSVTEQADKKCKKVVREAKKINPASTVVIMGCYAQLKPEEISNIPGVDLVLGANEKFQLPDLLPPYLNKKNTNLPKLLASEIRYDLDYHASYSVNDRTRTFLKVQDGCDYPCSYCTIPLARGQSRSDTVESVLALIEEIAKKGVKEIVLTGVNIGDFGIQQGKREETFFDLIKTIEFKSSINRFRISSIEPNLITPEIITFLSNSNSFVPHFHIPLQSGSNAVLRLMKRRYQRELYVNRVALIKSLMPNACIGVDVIVDRDIDSWLELFKGLAAKASHSTPYQFEEVLCKTYINTNKVLGQDLTDEELRAIYTAHDQKVTAFFAGKPNYIKIELGDPQISAKLRTFLSVVEEIEFDASAESLDKINL